ncbi:DUF6817 domain-containing protein [Streptomyces spiramyceticus]|uniref:DUF6817 domain-containing protein n=1 Tax=Streptomyces spiramyceticus TaxID=299717 RepID=UPI00237B0B98|nr:hypothetical protein [Streptomyces spiramyceticus]
MSKASVDLLESVGAGEVKHPGGTLLSHLLRVERKLEEWGAREDVREAGLLHALFAPDGSPDPMYSMLELDQRPRVAEVIGEPAEGLVYLYGAMDRKYTYPHLNDDSDHWRDRFTGEIRTLSQQEIRDLMEISVANECDIASHNPEFHAKYGPEFLVLFTRMRSTISEDAWSEVQNVLA